MYSKNHKQISIDLHSWNILRQHKENLFKKGNCASYSDVIRMMNEKMKK